MAYLKCCSMPKSSSAGSKNGHNGDKVSATGVYKGPKPQSQTGGKKK